MYTSWPGLIPSWGLPLAVDWRHRARFCMEPNCQQGSLMQLSFWSMCLCFLLVRSYLMITMMINCLERFCEDSLLMITDRHKDAQTRDFVHLLRSVYTLIVGFRPHKDGVYLQIIQTLNVYTKIILNIYSKYCKFLMIQHLIWLIISSNKEKVLRWRTGRFPNSLHKRVGESE